jgi:hypothetical protein
MRSGRQELVGLRRSLARITDGPISGAMRIAPPASRTLLDVRHDEIAAQARHAVRLTKVVPGTPGSIVERGEVALAASVPWFHNISGASVR